MVDKEVLAFGIDSDEATKGAQQATAALDKILKKSDELIRQRAKLSQLLNTLDKSSDKYELVAKSLTKVDKEMTQFGLSVDKVKKKTAGLNFKGTIAGATQLLGAFGALQIAGKIGQLFASLAEEDERLAESLNKLGKEAKNAKREFAGLVSEGFSALVETAGEGVSIVTDFLGAFEIGLSKVIGNEEILIAKQREFNDALEEFESPLTAATKELTAQGTQLTSNQSRMVQVIAGLEKGTLAYKILSQQIASGAGTLRGYGVELDDVSRKLLEQVEAEKAADLARKKSEQQAKTNAKALQALEQALADEIAALQLSTEENERRILDRRLEQFKAFTDDKIAIAQFGADLEVLIEEQKRQRIEKAQNEINAFRDSQDNARIAATEAAEEKLEDIRRQGREREIKGLEENLELFADLGFVGRAQVKAARDALDRITEIRIEDIEAQQNKAFEELLLAQEKDELTLEQQEIFDEQIIELEEQKQDALQRSKEQELAIEQKVADQRRESIAALTASSSAFLKSQGVQAAFGKRGAKIRTLAVRVEELVATQQDFAQALTHLAPPPNPNFNPVTAAGLFLSSATHAAAAAFAGKSSGQLSAQAGGRVPSVPGLPSVGDVIPARLEVDEIIVPRPFAQEFPGLSEFLGGGGAGGGGGGMNITLDMRGMIMLGSDRSTAREFVQFVGNELDNQIRRGTFSPTEREA